MGGGRQVERDRIDPRVGLSDVVALGTRVERGDPIATIHAADEASAQAAAQAVLLAVTISQATETSDLILDRIEP